MKLLLSVMMTAGIAIGIASPAAADEPTTKRDGYFNNDFDSDLNSMLDPNAEEGPSLPPMWPRISIPALSTQQVEKMVRGNTLRRDEDAAVYFASDGSLEGWINDWAPVSADRCPATEKAGDAVRRHAEKCEGKKTTYATGSWQTRNNAVCVELRMPHETERQCWYLAIVSSKVALFEDNGEVLGELKALKAGRVLGQLGD